jgi:hypothetical protein
VRFVHLKGAFVAFHRAGQVKARHVPLAAALGVASRRLLQSGNGGGNGAFGQTYRATLEVDRADRVANWRPIVQWLLAIPH